VIDLWQKNETGRIAAPFFGFRNASAGSRRRTCRRRCDSRRPLRAVEVLCAASMASMLPCKLAHNMRTVISLPVSCAGPSGLRSGLPNCGELISKTSPILVSIFLVKLPVAAPKKLHVHVAGLTEGAVLEMVVFEIGDGMAHVSSPESHSSAHISRPSRISRARPETDSRQFADQQLRPVAALAHFRVRQIEMFWALHGVIRVFVAECKANPQHPSLVPDQVQADDFDFLAAVERIRRQLQRLFGANQRSGRRP